MSPRQVQPDRICSGRSPRDEWPSYPVRPTFRMRSLPLWVCLVLLAPACAVHETRPLPPPMSDAETIQRGESWCASHGYGCTARRVVRRGDLVEVVFDAHGHGSQGPLRLEY